MVIFLSGFEHYAEVLGERRLVVAQRLDAARKCDAGGVSPDFAAFLLNLLHFVRGSYSATTSLCPQYALAL
jgi:hypothetical protein